MFAPWTLRIVSVVCVQEKKGFLVFRYTWMGLLFDFLTAFSFVLLFTFLVMGFVLRDLRLMLAQEWWGFVCIA